MRYFVIVAQICQVKCVKKTEKIYETFPKINWRTCIESVCVKQKSTIKISYITNINNSIS